MPKKVKNQRLTGQRISNLLAILVNCINNNKNYNIHSLWDKIIQDEIQNIFEKCIQKIEKDLTNFRNKIIKDKKVKNSSDFGDKNYSNLSTENLLKELNKIKYNIINLFSDICFENTGILQENAYYDFFIIYQRKLGEEFSFAICSIFICLFCLTFLVGAIISS